MRIRSIVIGISLGAVVLAGWHYRQGELHKQCAEVAQLALAQLTYRKIDHMSARLALEPTGTDHLAVALKRAADQGVVDAVRPYLVDAHSVDVAIPLGLYRAQAESRCISENHLIYWPWRF